MPLLPTHALLANDPAKQACYGFKRKSVSDSHIDFSIPLSYNDILNSPPTDIEEKARWALVKKTFILASIRVIILLIQTPISPMKLGLTLQI